MIINMLKAGKRVISLVISVSFLLTSIPQGFAFADTLQHKKATLAAPSKFGQHSIEAKDAWEIEMWFMACLAYHSGVIAPGQKKVDITRELIDRFRKDKARGQDLPSLTIFHPKGAQFFVHEIKTIQEDGTQLIMVRREDDKYGRRTYFIRYNANGKFIVYPEKRSDDKTLGNVEAERRYKQSNQTIIDPFIEARIKAGDFTEIEGRAASLAWDEMYPDRVRPKTYLHGSVLANIKGRIDPFLDKYGTCMDKTLAGRNIVLIRAPMDETKWPVIEEGGRKITVHSHLSSNALYIFLKPPDFDLLKESYVKEPMSVLVTPYPQELDSIFDNLVYRTMHEVGVSHDFRGQVADVNGVSEIRNALDDEYAHFLKEMVPAYTYKPDDRIKEHPELAKLAGEPVDLNTNLDRRDYAAGFGRDPYDDYFAREMRETPELLSGVFVFDLDELRRVTGTSPALKPIFLKQIVLTPAGIKRLAKTLMPNKTAAAAGEAEQILAMLPQNLRDLIDRLQKGDVGEDEINEALKKARLFAAEYPSIKQAPGFTLFRYEDLAGSAHYIRVLARDGGFTADEYAEFAAYKKNPDRSVVICDKVPATCQAAIDAFLEWAGKLKDKRAWRKPAQGRQDADEASDAAYNKEKDTSPLGTCRIITGKGGMISVRTADGLTTIMETADKGAKVEAPKKVTPTAVPTPEPAAAPAPVAAPAATSITARPIFEFCKKILRGASHQLYAFEHGNPNQLREFSTGAAAKGIEKVAATSLLLMHRDTQFNAYRAIREGIERSDNYARLPANSRKYYTFGLVLFITALFESPEYADMKYADKTKYFELLRVAAADLLLDKDERSRELEEIADAVIVRVYKDLSQPRPPAPQPAPRAAAERPGAEPERLSTDAGRKAELIKEIVGQIRVNNPGFDEALAAKLVEFVFEKTRRPGFYSRSDMLKDCVGDDGETRIRFADGSGLRVNTDDVRAIRTILSYLKKAGMESAPSKGDRVVPVVVLDGVEGNNKIYREPRPRFEAIRRYLSEFYPALARRLEGLDDLVNSPQEARMEIESMQNLSPIDRRILLLAFMPLTEVNAASQPASGRDAAAQPRGPDGTFGRKPDGDPYDALILFAENSEKFFSAEGFENIDHANAAPGISERTRQRDREKLRKWGWLKDADAPGRYMLTDKGVFESLQWFCFKRHAEPLGMVTGRHPETDEQLTTTHYSLDELMYHEAPSNLQDAIKEPKVAPTKRGEELRKIFDTALTAALERPGFENFLSGVKTPLDGDEFIDEMKRRGPEGIVLAAVFTSTIAELGEEGPEALAPLFHAARGEIIPANMEIAEMTALAKKAGEFEIPTHPDNQYTLLVPTGLYKNGEELDAHALKFKDRFVLNGISGLNQETLLHNIVEKAAGNESRTIALVPADMNEMYLNELASKGIRFILCNVETLANDSERENFLTDTYAVMVLARHVKSDTPPDSAAYNLLRFYLKSHFKLFGIAADDYIKAIIGRDIISLLKGVLAFRPAEQYDLGQKYHNIAVVMLSA